MQLQPFHRGLAAMCLVFLCAGLAQSQDGEESILVRARRLATTEKKPKDALRLLSDYLAEHPEDYDALVTQGLIFSWEGRYDEARKSLRIVLAYDPDYSDAVLALFNVEMWSGNPEQAELLAREGLERRPEFEPYLEALRKAVARVKSDREDAAHGRAGEGWRELQNGSNWQAVVSQDSTFFSDGRSPYREEQIGIKRLTSFGSYQLRASQSDELTSTPDIPEITCFIHITDLAPNCSSGWATALKCPEASGVSRSPPRFRSTPAR
jgi:tetratricopeptide (TPR) repeat protein